MAVCLARVALYRGAPLFVIASILIFCESGSQDAAPAEGGDASGGGGSISAGFSGSVAGSAGSELPVAGSGGSGAADGGFGASNRSGAGGGAAVPAGGGSGEIAGSAGVFDSGVAETGIAVRDSAVESGYDPPPPPSVDCAALPPLPIAEYKQINVPGSEDFTFDKQGYLVGVSGLDNALFRTIYEGNGEQEVLIPNIGSADGPFPVRGLRFLAGSDSDTGTLVFADVGAGGLSKVNLQDATRTTVMTGVTQPNGVTVDDKGFVYMSGMDGNVHRIDSNTGDSSIILPSTGFSIDGIALSPDFKRLYINTEMGYISYVPFDEDGNAGEHVVMAQITGSAGLLDGLAVDECGNIYVVQMSGTIWRVSPDSLFEGDQKVEEAFHMVPETETETERYRSSMFAANFGSGVGGWKAESLYIMNMYRNCVYEVDFGVKGVSQVHLR